MTNDNAPIACTLSGGTYHERLAWIAQLNRDGLRGCHRDGVRLELRYAPEVRDRVHEMVRKEQACCGFLDFNVVENAAEVRVIITVPERARDAADRIFDQFSS
jgi:hypothetical protein